MNSPCKNYDNAMSTVEDVSVAIDNLSLLTTSSNESSCPSKNSEVHMVEQVVLPQSDQNCNEMYTNNCSLITRNVTTIRSDVQNDNREHEVTIPEDFNRTRDGGLSSVISTPVVPCSMIMALSDSINDKVKLDYVIRQNDSSNPQQNFQRTLRSNSLDCVITLYDSESESSDFTLDSEDDSDDSELEYVSRFSAQKLTSTDEESLHSDGESVESSEYLSDSDEDSSDSDGDSSDSDDDPSDVGEQDPDEEPREESSDDDSDEDSAAASDNEKPDSSSDEDSEDDGSSSISDGEVADLNEEEEDSSDDDKSIDLNDTSDPLSDPSDSQSDASDSES